MENWLNFCIFLCRQIDLPHALEVAQEAREVLLSHDSDAIMKASGLPPALLPTYDFRFEDVYLISAAQRLNITCLAPRISFISLFSCRTKGGSAQLA